MQKLLKLKEIIASNDTGGAIVTLLDGRCAIVDINKRWIGVDMFIDTFLKWGAFDRKPTDSEIESITRVIENPVRIEETRDAKAYLTDPSEKNVIDRIKKQSDMIIRPSVTRLVVFLLKRTGMIYPRFHSKRKEI